MEHFVPLLTDCLFLEVDAEQWLQIGVICLSVSVAPFANHGILMIGQSMALTTVTFEHCAKGYEGSHSWLLSCSRSLSGDKSSLETTENGKFRDSVSVVD